MASEWCNLCMYNKHSYNNFICLYLSSRCHHCWNLRLDETLWQANKITGHSTTNIHITDDIMLQSTSTCKRANIFDSKNPQDPMIYKVPKHHLTFIFFGESLPYFRKSPIQSIFICWWQKFSCNHRSATKKSKSAIEQAKKSLRIENMQKHLVRGECNEDVAAEYIFNYFGQKYAASLLLVLEPLSLPIMHVFIMSITASY